MSMIAIGVGVAAVGVGGAVMANQAGKQSSPGMAPLINAQDEQNTAIQGNLAAMPSAEQLSSETNQFNQSQAVSMMNQAMPGYSSLASTLTNQAQQLAANPYALPPGLQQKLQQQAAQMGVSTGRTGQAGQFSLMQDLGINELQAGQTQLGEAQGLTGLLASIAPKVNPMSPMSMMITPAQQIAVAQGNQGMQQGQLNAQTAAANANASANASMWGNISSSIIGGMTVGAGGGGGGMMSMLGGMGGGGGAGGGAAMPNFSQEGSQFNSQINGMNLDSTFQ